MSVKYRDSDFIAKLHSGQRVRNHEIRVYIDPRKLEYPDQDAEEVTFGEYKSGVTGYGSAGLGTPPDSLPTFDGFLLQENGSYLLTESGDKIIIGVR